MMDDLDVTWTSSTDSSVDLSYVLKTLVCKCTGPRGGKLHAVCMCLGAGQGKSPNSAAGMMRHVGPPRSAPVLQIRATYGMRMSASLRQRGSRPWLKAYGHW